MSTRSPRSAASSSPRTMSRPPRRNRPRARGHRPMPLRRAHPAHRRVPQAIRLSQRLQPCRRHPRLVRRSRPHRAKVLNFSLNKNQRTRHTSCELISIDTHPRILRLSNKSTNLPEVTSGGRSHWKWHVRGNWSPQDDRIPSAVWLAILWIGMIVGFGLDAHNFLD